MPDVIACTLCALHQFTADHPLPFLPRDGMHRGTSHGSVSACVCMSVSVSVSVTSRCSTNTAKRIGSHKQHHTIPQRLQFSDAKDLSEIRPGSPLRGRQMQVGWIKIGEFRQIAGYISKTVKDRHIVSMKVEQEVVCALSNCSIAVDPECPLTAPNYPIFCILHRHSQRRNG